MIRLADEEHAPRRVAEQHGGPDRKPAGEVAESNPTSAERPVARANAERQPSRREQDADHTGSVVARRLCRPPRTSGLLASVRPMGAATSDHAAGGPSFEVEGKMARYRDVIELKSDDHRTLTARMLGEHGQWHELMTTRYRRTR